MSIPYERLQQFEGGIIGQPRRAPDEVDAAMIRHWCRAMGNSNPIYVDDAAARAAGHQGLVAPASMLQAWTLLDRRDVPLPPFQMQEELRDLLASDGITTVVATNCDQEYERYLRPGERLTSTATLSSISPEKKTRFGPGHFVTTLFNYQNQGGEEVARATLRCLVFRPTDSERSGTPRASSQEASSPVGSDIRVAQTSAGASAGDGLPDLVIPITPSLIIIGALSTMDFNVIHHDRDRAQADGSKDILMNIYTTLGVIERYVTDWMPPSGRFRKIGVQLGAPNFPGDKMTLRGAIEDATPANGGTDLRLRLTGVNSLGTHATAGVEIWLPSTE